MYIRQISIFLENRSGTLAEVTDFLYHHGVNLRALSIADTAEFGILRIIVDKPEETLALHRTDNAYQALLDEVIASLADRKR